jgi:hypothetical protein
MGKTYFMSEIGVGVDAKVGGVRGCRWWRSIVVVRSEVADGERIGGS